MSDLISRQAAIDALTHFTNLSWDKLKIVYPMLTVIEELPSAGRHGRWIENETSYADPPTKQTCNCSICGQASIRPLGDWCRWCGSRMDLDGDTE